jgi:hypothetical protein
MIVFSASASPRIRPEALAYSCGSSNGNGNGKRLGEAYGYPSCRLGKPNQGWAVALNLVALMTCLRYHVAIIYIAAHARIHWARRRFGTVNASLQRLRWQIARRPPSALWRAACKPRALDGPSAWFNRAGGRFATCVQLHRAARRLRCAIGGALAASPRHQI